MDKKSYTDENGFRITELITDEGLRYLARVTGEGSCFSVPEGIYGITIPGEGFSGGISPRQAKAFLETVNLTEVFIPSSVKVIGPGAFDIFGSNLEIHVDAESQPEGFFDGTYSVLDLSDGFSLTVRKGSWLSMDSEKKNLPRVYWL